MNKAQADHRSERSLYLSPRRQAPKEPPSAWEREHRQFRQALFAAVEMQRKLCAPRELRRGPFEIISENFPVRYISGDFHSLLDLRPATGVAVGDIGGKGLTAGLWFTHFVSLTRQHAGAETDPGAALAAINADLCRLRLGAPLAALFLARLDPERNELAYGNAGQPPALLLRREGTAEWLEEGGPLLGAVSHASFESRRVSFGPGDTLIVYSDGIVECRNHAGEEFGGTRLLAAARSAAGSSPATQLFSILGAAEDFSDGLPLEDDITLMVVRHRG